MELIIFFSIQSSSDGKTNDEDSLDGEDGGDLGNSYLIGGADQAREIGLALMPLMAFLTGKPMPLIGNKNHAGRGSACVNATNKAAKETVSSKECNMMLVSASALSFTWTQTQEKLCGLFKELFLYNKDEDFVFYIPVVQDVLDEFMYSDGPGPDIKDLYLDCWLGWSLAWNSHAMDLVITEFDDRLTNDTERDWPAVTIQYLEEMVWRFYKLTGIWWVGQAQLDSDGHEENSDAILDQLKASKVHKAKKLHHWTHYSNVCI